MERKRSIMGGPIMGNSGAIKGLQLFIADLRQTQHSREHDKRINGELVKIKQLFDSDQNGKLGGYQRKKYVAKLAYMYITSNTTRVNDILFALEEIMVLLRSVHIGEKFVGYMTLGLLMGHRTVVDRIANNMIPQLLADLSQNNDDCIALALNFIGVCGNLCTNFAFDEDLVFAVFQILRSPTASSYLKKKSSLAFLALLKSNLSILTDDLSRKQIWIQRIISLLDDTDNYRLTLASLPLVECIAKNIDPSFCFRLLPQLTDNLYNCVVLGTSDNLAINQFPSEYKFASFPNPWLITDIVSLLNVIIATPYDEDMIGKDENSNNNKSNHNLANNTLYASDIDQEILNKLRKCVLQAIALGNTKRNNPIEKIVQNTILYSLINFAPKLNPSDDALINSVSVLCSLLVSPDINIRYLTLDSLIKLCSTSKKVVMDSIRFKNLNLILQLMNQERDASIVRKSVDLLYTFTDSDNVEQIVEQLLKFTLNAKNITDPSLRSHIAVKIAILTEKFATDSNWYINISLKILSLTFSNSFNDAEIWHRLCQIVVNNPSLRKLTCEKLITYLQHKQTSEYIVKTSAFLLGEYISLVMDTVSVGNIFNIFCEQYFQVSNLTRGMILTTMIQLYKAAPEIGSAVIKFFQLELNSLDIELQTRSYEYLKIIQISKVSENMNLLDMLFQPMPPFNTKSNPLLKRLGSLPSNSADITLVDNSQNNSNINLNKGQSPTTKDNNYHIDSTRSLPPPIPIARKLTMNSSNSAISMSSNTDRPLPVLDKYTSQQLSVDWHESYQRMLSHNQGIFYTSPFIKIIYKITYLELFHLKIALTYVNQTEWEITGLSTEIIPNRINDNPEYIIQNSAQPNSSILLPHKRTEQFLEIIIRKPFDSQLSPKLNLFFKCGSNISNIILKFGIGMTSTIFNASYQPATLVDFVKRWKMLGDSLGKDAEFNLEDIRANYGSVASHTTPMELAIDIVAQKLRRVGFDIVDQTNIKNTLFVTGIVHTKTDGNFGCLLKLNCQEDQRFNITCKTSAAGPMAQYVATCVKDIVT